MIRSLLQERFWIGAYLALLAGLWLPGTYDSWKPVVPYVLGGILYFSGLRLKAQHVRAVFTGKRWYGIALFFTCLRLLLLPLAAYAVLYSFGTPWAVGVLLVCLMPSGLTSIAFTDLHRGNVPLAVLQIVCTGLLCPISIPVLLALVGTSETHIEYGALLSQALYIMLLLVIPLSLACVTRLIAAKTIARYQNYWGPSAILCSIILVFISIAASRSAWSDASIWEIMRVMWWCCFAAAIMGLFGLVVHVFMERKNATVFGVGNLYMNNGLAIAFALHFFPGNKWMILPAAMMQVAMITGVMCYGRWLTYLERRSAEWQP